MKNKRPSKLIKNIKKNAAVKFFILLFSISPFVDCPTPTPNEAPNTHITKEFPDDGNVEYTFPGTDDVCVDYIKVKINNGGYQNFSNNSSVSVPIIEGNNTVEAIAYDNKGEADPTPATYSFNSPTEYEARTLIDTLLDSKGINLEDIDKDVILYSWGNILVDYLITKNEKPTVVNYIGHQNNLKEELNNKRVLDGLTGKPPLPNLYIPRFPESKITEDINEFIDNNYN